MTTCCGCRDDEAYKSGECFCLCHTRDHQSNFAAAPLERAARGAPRLSMATTCGKAGPEERFGNRVMRKPGDSSASERLDSSERRQRGIT